MIRILLVLILGVMFFSSCAPPVRIVGRDYQIIDSVRFVDVVREVKIPELNIKSPAINIDSIVRMLEARVPTKIINEKLMYVDPETQRMVGILVDELGNLTAVCEQQEHMIKVLTQDREYYKHELERITFREEKGWWQRFRDQFTNVIFYLIIITLLAIILNKK